MRPQLTAGAARVLQQFYLDLRQRHHNTNAAPITTRQLESLIRLTEVTGKVWFEKHCTNTLIFMSFVDFS